MSYFRDLMMAQGMPSWKKQLMEDLGIDDASSHIGKLYLSINNKATHLNGFPLYWQQIIATNQIPFQNAKADTRTYWNLRINQGSAYGTTLLNKNLSVGATGHFYYLIKCTSTTTRLYLLHNGSSVDILILNPANIGVTSGHTYLVHFYLTSSNPSVVGGINGTWNMFDLNVMFPKATKFDLDELNECFDMDIVTTYNSSATHCVMNNGQLYYYS